MFVVSVKDPWPHLISSYHMGVSYSQLIPSVKGIATTIQSFLLVEKYVEKYLDSFHIPCHFDYRVFLRWRAP